MTSFDSCNQPYLVGQDLAVAIVVDVSSEVLAIIRK